MLETIMRSSYLLLAVVVSLGACAQFGASSPISSTTVTRWQNRDVSELITAIGPFDTTTIQGESRSYFWNRFGNCQLTARTTREEKIVNIDVQGTTQGCSAYLEKMGDGKATSPKT
jgi:hypothetical protein